MFSATAPTPRTGRTQPIPPAGPRTHSGTSPLDFQLPALTGVLPLATSAKHAPQPPQRSRTMSGGRARRAMPTPPQSATAGETYGSVPRTALAILTVDGFSSRPGSRRGLPTPPAQEVQAAGALVDNPLAGPPSLQRNSTSASQVRLAATLGWVASNRQAACRSVLARVIWQISSAGREWSQCSSRYRRQSQPAGHLFLALQSSAVARLARADTAH